MKTFTIDDIRGMGPCYDPSRYLPESWTGTALDILAVDDCPAQDRLWVVLHNGWVDDRTMRLFAVWCARQALGLAGNPDPRSIAACDVAERHANEEATTAELAAARAAACDAASTAAWAAAWADASTAARAAAWAAARAAAWAAASDAASDAAWAAQVAQLRAMLTEAR
jgi:hypothetical protein